MTPDESTLNMLVRLHQEIRPVFESHVPDSYAKEDALYSLDMAFYCAKEAINAANS